MRVCVFREESGIELGGGSFLIHKHYKDEDTHTMMLTTSKILGEYHICLYTLQRQGYSRYDTHHSLNTW